MRLLSLLSVVLVICLVAIALPVAPAEAAETYIKLTPDDGVPGEEVTFRGNLTANSDVKIYYYRDGTSIKVDDDETSSTGYFIGTFTVPESCTGDHQVRAVDEDDIEAFDYFTVEPGLTVDLEEGTVGTTVTVEGHGFAEDEEDIELRYYLNDHDYETVAENIEANENGWWEYSFDIPPSAKDDHKIDAQGEDSKLHDVKDTTVEVTPSISLNKTSGVVGDNISMTGNGFYADDSYIKILFAGEEAETEPEIIRAKENGSWNGTFQVPEMPKGTYSVTAEGQLTKKEDISAWDFTIAPGLLLSPDEGHVGMNLTVTGRGFAKNKDVAIMYDGSEVETATTDAEGSFLGASFLVPKGIHGPHEVTAEDAAENEATAIFTMESEPPDTPALISPPDRGRVGFIGKVRPTFEWSEVEDPSGVYYSLQIATIANVTATGFVDDPVFSIEGLVETSYRLTEAEALTYDTYYWIVQAVDGAGNAGNWTSASSFRAGLLPLWGFIVIIVAIVVLIGALVYFFVIRKRIYYY